MKKLFAIILGVFCSSLLFAKSEAYEKLFAQAKQYEEQGKLVSAMATYYEAMEAEPTFEAYEAYQSFEELANAVKSGKPGLGEFDDFDLFDGWKALVEDYEYYWSENSTCDFITGKLERGENNYETRTTSYELKCYASYSPKYELIDEIVTEGYKKAYRRDWKGLVAEWPKYGNSDVPATYLEWDKKRLAFGMELTKYYNSITDTYCYGCGNYGMTIKVTYSGDKLLARYGMLYSDQTLTITDVSADLVKVLKDDNVKIDIVDVKLKVRDKFLDVKNYKIMPLETGIYTTDVRPIVLRDYWLTEIKNNTDKYCPVVYVKGDESIDSFYMGTTEVTQELFEGVIGSNPCTKFVSPNNPVQNLTWYDAVYFCNKLSILAGLTPCYYLDFNKETDPDKWGRSLYSTNYWNAISVDMTADGYRLPTVDEWVYAARKGISPNDSEKADDFLKTKDVNEFAWINSNSGGSVHEVAQKEPNFLGIYDMFGNVWEWCWGDDRGKKPNIGSGYLGVLNDLNHFDSDSINQRGSDCGFRVVRTVK